jgi:chemotaxis protein MotB
MSSSELDGSDETGEGYFASVSDLMVGILFVFLLMLTVFALNFREEEDKQKIEYSKYLALQ